MLEIEIVTTKKKLSKQIVKQLGPASLGDLNHLVNNKVGCGYHIRNLGAGYPPIVFIFKGVNGWVLCERRQWKKRSNEGRMFYYTAKGSVTKKFKDPETCEVYFNAYKNAEKLCMENHLIL